MRKKTKMSDDCICEEGKKAHPMCTYPPCIENGLKEGYGEYEDE